MSKHSKATNSITPLLAQYQQAIAHNNLARFKALLKSHGLNVMLDEKGITPFLLCCIANAPSLIKMILKQDNTLVNSMDIKGHSGLMMAVSRGHLDTVKLLIKSGVDINHQRQDGVSALMLACHNNHIPCLQALLKSGAKVHLANNAKNKALHYAAISGNPLTTELLLTYGAKLNSTNSKQQTALMIATHQGHYHTVRVLIAAGAEVNRQEKIGYNALILAARRGHIDCLQALLEAGAQANPITLRSHHPFRHAAAFGQIEACKTLLTWGAAITEEQIPRLEFHPDLADEKRQAVIDTIVHQPTLLNQFSDLGYSAFMSDLYSGIETEHVLCQRLVNLDFEQSLDDYTTPHDINIIRACAISNKPDLLLTAAILATDADLLLSADILSQLKKTLPINHQKTIKQSLTLLKNIQRIISQYQPLISAGADYATLPSELMQFDILPTLLKELSPDKGPWFDKLIQKIIHRAATINQQKLLARNHHTKAFEHLLFSHPALLSSQENIDKKIRQQMHAYQFLSSSEKSELLSKTTPLFSIDQPLSTLPTHVLWQRYLLEDELKNQLTLLFTILHQDKSPWLQSSKSIIWQQLFNILSRPLDLDYADTLASKVSQLSNQSDISASEIDKLLYSIMNSQNTLWLDAFSTSLKANLTALISTNIKTKQKAMKEYIENYPDYFDDHDPLIAAVLEGLNDKVLKNLNWQPLVDGICLLLDHDNFTNSLHDMPSDQEQDRREDECIYIAETASLFFDFLSNKQLRMIIDALQSTDYASYQNDAIEVVPEYAQEIIFLRKLRKNLTANKPPYQKSMRFLISEYRDHFKDNAMPLVNSIINNSAPSRLQKRDWQTLVSSLCSLLSSEQFFDLWNEGSPGYIEKQNKTLSYVSSMLCFLNRQQLDEVIETLDDLGIWAPKIKAAKAYALELKQTLIASDESYINAPDEFIKKAEAIQYCQSKLRHQSADKEMIDYQDTISKKDISTLYTLVSSGEIDTEQAQVLLGKSTPSYNQARSLLKLTEFYKNPTSWSVNHLTNSSMLEKTSFFASKKRVLREQSSQETSSKRHHSHGYETNNKPRHCQSLFKMTESLSSMAVDEKPSAMRTQM